MCFTSGNLQVIFNLEAISTPVALKVRRIDIMAGNMHERRERLCWAALCGDHLRGRDTTIICPDHTHTHTYTQTHKHSLTYTHIYVFTNTPTL